MRSPDELQRAHDILVQLILDPNLRIAVVGSKFQDDLIRYAEVLCWCLGHEHNPAFANNMAYIFRRLEALGMEVYQYPTMQNTEAE